MERTTQHRLDWMISVDDHILEPPSIWQNRVPKRYLEAAPRIAYDGDNEFWLFEGRRFPTPGLAAVAGKRTDEITPHATSYAEMRPGCYDPVAAGGYGRRGRGGVDQLPELPAIRRSDLPGS